MKARLNNRLLASALAAAFALAMTPVVDQVVESGLVSQAQAAEKGKGGQSDQGKGGMGGSGMQKGGGAGGASKAAEDVLKGGAPEGKGGKPAVSSSSTKLGRLSMARAYLSPSFDPSKIDDPEAPLANLDAYRESLLTGTTPVVPTLESLAAYLAKVATSSITGASIIKLNELLSVTSQFTATGIDPTALATLVNQLVKENREE